MAISAIRWTTNFLSLPLETKSNQLHRYVDYQFKESFFRFFSSFSYLPNGMSSGLPEVGDGFDLAMFDKK